MLLLIFLFIVVILGVGAFVISGPKGCSRTMQSWSASAYGSDWFVVQYAYDGSVITTWELQNKSVENESSSDGIVFVDNAGNVTHLSGHYVYVQVAGGKDGFRRAKEKLLPQGEGLKKEEEVD